MSDIPYGLWEPVIGLEIHVQLNTKTKLFSPAPNRFGDEPNTNISVVCTGQPGSLPVLNKEAVKKAVQFGVAVHGRIQPFSKFDRKSYFYPDTPRNYQITQFYNPIILGGFVTAEIDDEVKTFLLNRAHLEDDAGTLKHFSSFVGVDYNRAGTPLLEIVSEPCIHSAKDAVAFANAIKAIMEYIDASDCNMEEGSLRMDANVSVRPKNTQELRNKIEIKNMNSFANMEIAINAEIQRQIIAYSTHPDDNPRDVVEEGTHRFDPDLKKTVLMRKKELAEDYRYFPEPDLPPLVLSRGYIETIKRSLPELPKQRYDRYLSLKLTKHAASVLINNKALSDYFEEALDVCNNPKALSNWITVEFVGRLKGGSLITSGIKPVHIAHLVNLVDQGTITGKLAKILADEMVAHPGKDCLEIINQNPDYLPMDNLPKLETIIDEVLRENPQSVHDYKAGKTKALAALVGKVMEKTQGKANPDLVNKLLIMKIDHHE